MSKLEVLPNLTKKYILERISQEEIMEFYTKVPVNDITLQGNSFLSPLRVDKHLTCNYYYKEYENGDVRLRLKDWNGSVNEDAFGIAGIVTKINIKSGQGFALLLHKIAYDFNIHQYSNNREERTKLELLIKNYIIKAETKVFKVIPRVWNNYDKRYWFDLFGIGSELLRIGKVIPVQELQIEGKDGFLTTNYKYYSKDPAYAYYGGNVNGINLWRVYFPLRKNRRFLNNGSFIQGLHMAEPARVCIITKSLKDVLCYKTFGITAVAVPSETYLMTKDEIFNLKSKFDVVITNFDYDSAGIRLANKYKKVHRCTPIMFTQGKHNQPDYEVKDFAEFVHVFGRERTIQLINLIIAKYSDDLEAINRYNYESLKWIKEVNIL